MNKLTLTKSERIEQAIAVLLSEFSEKDILEGLEEQTGKEYCETKTCNQMATHLENAGYFVARTDGEAIRALKREGYLVFKCETMQQETQFRDFAETVFPYYSDQQMRIL